MKHLYLQLLALLFVPVSLSAQFSGNALDFDGTNDQVQCASVPALFSNLASSDFTFEAWVNPRGAVFSRIFFAQPSTTNFTAVSTGGTNNIYFYVIANGTTYSIATTATLPQNQWTHVAARWTAATSTPEVFFNGVLQAGAAGGSSSTGTNGMMTLGTRPGGFQYFNGLMDEARLWSEARSACEISSNVNRSLNGAETNLLFTYDFNQGTAGGTNTGITNLPDISGNTNNGTLVNFALSGATSNWVSSAAIVNSSGSSVGGYSMTVNDSVCSGGSYTFPDGSTQSNITTPVVQTSTLPGPGGCDTVITTNLTSLALPQPVITGPVPACEYSTTMYAASLSPGTTVNWQLSGGYILGGQGTNGLSVLWGPAGPGSVSITETTAFGCVSTTTLNLMIVATYSITDSASVCMGGNYTYPDGSTDSSITSVMTHQSYFQTNMGCDSIITTIVTPFALPQPVITGPVPACEYSTTMYAASLSAGTTVNWQVAGGSILGGQGTNALTVLWGPAGPGSVTITETSAPGCDSTTTLNLMIVASYSLNDSAIVCMGGNYTYPDGSTDSSITSVTTHQSIFQSALGCDSIITTIVTPIPAYQITDSVNVCQGADFTFPDGFTQTGIQANFSHTSQLQTTLGCDSLIVTDVYVTVIDTTVLMDPFMVFYYAANPQPGMTFQWLTCQWTIPIPMAGWTDDTAYVVIDSNLTGMFWFDHALEFTLNGCVDTSSCHELIYVANDPSLDPFSIELYPNPAHDQLNVKVGMTDAGKWEIFSTLGHKIMGGEIQGTILQLGVADLPAGLYLLEVSGVEGKVAQRFIKE